MTVEIGRPLGAALVLASLLGLGGLALAGALAGLWSAEEERDTKAAFVSRSLSTIPPALRPAGSDPFVEAGSETLAAARIDALLRSTTADQGGSVLSSRAEVQHDDADIPGRIEVQAEIEAPNDALQAILLRLENGSPVMLVETLSVAPAEIAPVAAGDLRASPALHVAMTLSAFWKASPK